VNKWQQRARWALEFMRDVVALVIGAAALIRGTFWPPAIESHFWGLISLGLTLVAPGVAVHVRALLPSSDAGSLLESAAEHRPSPSPPPSSTSSEEGQDGE
jgi:hypothetical protein